ncbi:MAG: SUMF1/EgtB/PvdO family nonheme iron enzyme [Phycisphaerae bacterium]|nr:SUMF1/EgtB/PvdO family nonheme iron enzyme [Saprospiraceae bacterium]
MPKPLKTFIIYAREDTVFKNELLRQLAPFARMGLLEKWDDSDILPGEEWEKSIENALEASHIVLMLVSADSLFSEFIQRKELKKALEQKREGLTCVIPILVRDCMYDMAEGIHDLQMLPLHPVNRSLTPVDDLATWGSRASAWAAALRQLREVVNELHARIEDEEKTLREKVEKLAALAAEAQRAEEAKVANAMAAKEAEARREKNAKLQRSKDEAAWKVALELDSLEAYEDYIDKYNLHEAEAHEQIGKLIASEAKLRAAQKAKAKSARLVVEAQPEKLPDGGKAAIVAQPVTTDKQASFLDAATDLLGDALFDAYDTAKAVATVVTEKTEEITGWNSDPFDSLMVPIKGGTFDMGDTFGDGGSTEKPVHKVTLRDFHICKYPVTQAQWKAIMGDNPSHFKGDDLPVEKVSWDDTQGFIKKLNEKTGKKYRLPTESEWEYAAKGGTISKGFKYSGSNQLEEVAWFVENSSSKTHPVGQKKPNELGLYDMSGNVWEWVEDDWHGNYNSAPDNGSAWVDNPRGSTRVFRSGTWLREAQFCRVAYRYHSALDNRSSHMGFRLALSLQSVG